MIFRKILAILILTIIPIMAQEIISADTLDVFEITAEEQPLQVLPQATVFNMSKAQKAGTWLALSLEALGAVALGFGVFHNMAAKESYNEYKYEVNCAAGRGAVNHAPADCARNAEGFRSDVKGAVKARDNFYTIGGILLASGIVIHFWF
jgi:hypothetical protein